MHPHAGHVSASCGITHGGIERVPSPPVVLHRDANDITRSSGAVCAIVRASEHNENVRATLAHRFIHVTVQHLVWLVRVVARRFSEPKRQRKRAIRGVGFGTLECRKIAVAVKREAKPSLSASNREGTAALVHERVARHRDRIVGCSTGINKATDVVGFHAGHVRRLVNAVDAVAVSPAAHLFSLRCVGTHTWLAKSSASR